MRVNGDKKMTSSGSRHTFLIPVVIYFYGHLLFMVSVAGFPFYCSEIMFLFSMS